MNLNIGKSKQEKNEQMDWYQLKKERKKERESEKERKKERKNERMGYELKKNETK